MDGKSQHSRTELEWVAALAGGGGGVVVTRSLFIVNNKLIKWLKCF